MSAKFVREASVISSTITKIGHTEGGDLVVSFTNGTDYLYKGVPTEVYDAMEKAESVGKFLNSQIKGKFQFEKLVKS
jgi:hypothetical protein